MAGKEVAALLLICMLVWSVKAAKEELRFNECITPKCVITCLKVGGTSVSYCKNQCATLRPSSCKGYASRNRILASMSSVHASYSECITAQCMPVCFMSADSTFSTCQAQCAAICKDYENP
uniref:Thionin-like protein 2 n=1 Tax=Nelumbo nucifera TaxID=4432 RepID=A0A822ZEB4_NELNU|nr:TPA_asm: hypothetical protein HUJ06_000311 [Nelumbo nucifera]